MYQALVRVRLPRIFGLVLRNPLDSLFAVALTLAITAIAVNGLYLQPGRHPAPIFAMRPLPVRSADNGVTAMAAQRSQRLEAVPPKPEPARRNDPAPRDSVPLPRRRHRVSAAMHADAAAIEGASPSWQVSAVQRTLNQAGYGPIRVTGILDDSTREGIARFERDHDLPVTGQNTLRMRRTLGAATGRPPD